MNYVIGGRQTGRKLVENQIMIFNILQAILTNKKFVFASPNKNKMKDEVITILKDNSVEYKFENSKIMFNSNGSIEFI